MRTLLHALTPNRLRRMAGCLLIAPLVAGSPPARAAGDPDRAAQAAAPDVRVSYHRTEVDGVQIFYREAGPRDAPAVLLLHGFPTSSHMYRELIPALSDRYRVVAPDYPGFGQSDFPPPGRYRYSFESFARTLDGFTRRIGLRRFALYVQDYGAPVGLRLALLGPERITALIVQNGNAYEEGLSPAWDPLKAYWREPSPANREKLRGWLTADGLRGQYAAGLTSEQEAKLSPDTWTLDWALLSRPGNVDVQLDLFADYRTNVDLYPEFQRFFREHRPPALVVWGTRDPFFTVAGARAYARDLPDAEVYLLDAGHFALETSGPQIARLMRDFLSRVLSR